MSQMQTERQSVPDWSLGWRLQRSLAFGGVSVQEMADLLGVSRGTISRWCNDRNRPRLSDLRVWADKTNVPLDWLVEGDRAARGGYVELPRLDSNQQPFGWRAEPDGPPGTAEVTSAGKPISELRRAIRRGAINDTDTSALRRVS